MGLSLKRALLERILADDPDPEMFGDWLLDEILNATATGPRRATGAQILDEYRLAAADPAYTHWLSYAGAQTAGAGEDGCQRGLLSGALPRRGRS
ncbi:MAG: hypothetical protein ACR2IK_06285 [Chloroflexota bacterium]